MLWIRNYFFFSVPALALIFDPIQIWHPFNKDVLTFRHPFKTNIILNFTMFVLKAKDHKKFVKKTRGHY